MLTLARLRHPFSAALGAMLLVVLMAGFVIPNSVIVCGWRPREPSFTGARTWNGEETDLVVTVKPDGMTLVGNEIITDDRLQAVLAHALDVRPDRRLVLRLDVRSPFGATRRVVRAAQALGVRHILIPTAVRSVADFWSTHD